LATSGVFSELKLSEQLNSNLQEVKRKFDDLSELQQETEQQCIQLKLKLKQVEKENKLLKEKVFKFKNVAKFNFFIKMKYQNQNL
jgi:predicted nuclease with TOPRIM domain